MATHTLTIPNWKPVSVNHLIGRHWSRVRKLKRADADVIAGYAMAQRIPEASGKRRLSVRIACPAGQAVDCDNCLKSLFDGLKACQRLVDDSAEWLELSRVEVVAGEPLGTVVTLEDVEN